LGRRARAANYPGDQGFTLCNELALELGHHPEETFSAGPVWEGVPGKVYTLLELLSTLQVKDSPANIFECQRRLGLTVKKTSHFYRGVAETAGRDRGIWEKRVQYG
uniref:Uncharacterized protein n=1 Tax=Oncorhynchus mykiss TaxID=8022 RepID=A0A8C7RCU6_ONCMY